MELDGAWSIVWKGDSEGVGIFTQLLEESVLDLGKLGLVSARVDLLRSELQVPAEVQTHHLVFLAPETVRDRNLWS